MRFKLLPAALLLAALASAQTISNFAGNGAVGYSGDNGPATQAELHHVVGLATDAAGNVYIADEINNVVRKVDTSGMITTFAGTGAQGFSGDNGPATQAVLNGPLGVCVAPSGVVYVNDQGNHRVRAISTSGAITTVAGGATAISFGDGTPAISAGMVTPVRCAVDQNGNLYIVDQGAHTVRKVNTQGIITTFAGIANSPGFSGENGPAVAAQMNTPTAASFDAAGNLYVTDQHNQRIRKIDTNGIITTVAGNGNAAFLGDHGPATSASLNFPGETVIDSAGNLFIVDTINQVIRLVSNGTINTVAGAHGTFGNLGDGGPPSQAQFNSPFGIALDSSANLYVGDTGNNRIRKISGLASASNNCTFSLSAGGQAFTAAGGAGSVDVSTQPACNWTLPTVPNWITITGFPPSGSGTVTFQVALNGGPDRFSTLTSSGVSFTVEQQAASISGLSFVGSMPHVAAQEHWTTLFTLVNKGPALTQARLSLFGDAATDPTGNGPLTLPLVFPQTSGASGPLLASTFDRNIDANASLGVTSAEAQTSPVLVGSAQLAAVGQVDGFAIFHLIPGSQEAVVPLETRNASSYLLAYDNTGGVVLAIAVENVSSQDALIPVVIRDETGTVIGPPGATISLAGNGHTSFVLHISYPVTVGKHGTIEFDTPAGGQISVLGIRTTPFGNTTTLTTIPALANVGTSGGSIAHIAIGNGWQTTFVLVNTGTTAAQANLNFFADVTGAALPMPLSFPLISSSTTTVTATVSQPLPAGATLLVQSTGVASDPTPTTGSAQLTTNGKVAGFVIFSHNGQEAVVPLENRQASGYILAFDNTAGTATGIAINSVSTQALNVPVIVRNDAGVQIATDTLNLAANGHLAFTLGSSLTGFKYPQTAAIRGTIEFDTPPGGQIGVLGIRIPVAHTFTTLPALTR